MGSEAKHTEGRLEVHEPHSCSRRLVDPDGRIVAEVFSAGAPKDGPEVQHANAARLAACWNACEGIADPEALRRERHEATALLRQSVDLISAGVLAAVFGGEMTAQAEERINRLVDDLRAFLAKTEGAP